MGKVMGFLRLIRPLNCTMMAFAVVVGASLVAPLNLTTNLFLGVATSFLLTAASMVINDYYDRGIDAINEPNRPIPKGDVKPKEALVFATVLSATGLAAAFETNMESFLVAIVAAIISVTYITKGKGTGLPGNFLVSATVVIPFIYGGLAVGQLQTSLHPAQRRAQEQAVQLANVPVWPVLVLAALALVCIEWLIYNLRVKI